MPSNNNSTHSTHGTRASPYYEVSGLRLSPLTNLQPIHHKMNGGLSGAGSARNGNGNAPRFSGYPSPPTLHNLTGGGGGGNVTISPKSNHPLIDLSRTASVQAPHPSPLNSSRKTPVNINWVRTSGGEGGGSGPGQGMDGSVIDIYGIHEMLASLALMCLLSLLMAFLALFFLQRTGPIIALPEDDGSDNSQKGSRNLNAITQTKIIVNTKEYVRVFQISVSLSTLTISLNLCCLFVCCIQFLSAVKLLKTPQGRKRTHEFLKKTSHVRVTAIGAFLISIPVFFTGVILFTFINFDEVPALATSVIIGIGIIFCGVASVQNVYLWQWEKTKASQELSETRLSQLRESGLLPPIELSTLV